MGSRRLILAVGTASALACGAMAVAQIRTTSSTPLRTTSTPATLPSSTTTSLTYDPFAAGTPPPPAPIVIVEGNATTVGEGRPVIRDPFRPPPRSPFIP